jgi:hypothetical protein
MHDQRARPCSAEYRHGLFYNGTKSYFGVFISNMTTRENELPFSRSSSELFYGDAVGSEEKRIGGSQGGGNHDSSKGSANGYSRREPSWSPLEALLNLSEVACWGSPKCLSRRPPNRGGHLTGELPEIAPTSFFFQSTPLDERVRQNSILQGVESTGSEMLTSPCSRGQL